MLKKFSKYFVGRSVPESYFPKGSKSEKILMPWITVMAILAIIFLVVFKSSMLPQNQYFYYMTLGMIYIPIGILAFIFNITELSEKSTPWGDSSTLLGSYKLWQVVAIGLGIGFLFIFPNFLGSIAGGLTLFTVKPLAVGTFGSVLIVGILIPIIENSFFAKFFVPSMFELGGRFNMAGPTGILIPSIVFGLVHAGSYGAFSAASPIGFILILTFPIIFRILTSIGILETKSYLPAFIAHIMVNTATILLV